MMQSCWFFGMFATIMWFNMQQSDAHSWIDCIDHSYDVVYTNSDAWVLRGDAGRGVCEGYAYNYPGRGDRAIGTEFTYKLLPNEIRSDSKSVCQYHNDQADYSEWRKRIHAKPGDKLYFAYFSNGHIIRDQSGVGTTYGIYWSGSSKQLEKPSDLTNDKLIDGQLHDFDDGNCGETYVDGNFAGGTTRSGRAGDYKPCIGSFTIPSNTAPGTYPMVWWWTFYKLPDFTTVAHGAGGAAYSSCFDVVIEGDASNFSLTSIPTTSPSSTPISSPSTPAPSATLIPESYEISATPTTSLRCNTQTPSTPITSSATTEFPPSSVMAPEMQIASPKPYSSMSTPESITSTPISTSSPNSGRIPATPAVTPESAPISTTAPPAPPAAPAAMSEPLASVKITNVGGSGVYGRITSIACPSSNTCQQEPVASQGPLAPFDEDLTLAFRGPMKIDEIAVFTSENHGSDWQEISSYSQGNVKNLVFLNNKGDATKSGEFDTCHGNSQSFATADAKTVASSATPFNGVLEGDTEMNIMSGRSCQETGGSCGVIRGIAYEGWSGNAKIFMVKAQMPHSEIGKDLPAIWLLNGQVVRTAQYGCNCRGMGIAGPWKGGCGELDIAETIGQDKGMLTSTIYSFKGARGTHSFASRPVDRSVVFVTIFMDQVPDSNLGTVQILMLDEKDVDFTKPPSKEQVQQWLNVRSGQEIDFDI